MTVELLFIDDYERALAKLSELADNARHEACCEGSRAAWTRSTAYASAFDAIAAIRPRIARTVASDLAEDR
jgi:hypothetical protein